MYVVVAGGGTYGKIIASNLMEHRHDVVVIEIDPEVCEYLYAKLGLLTVRGTATDINVLIGGGIQKADIAIATLPRDTENLSFALLAHSVGVPKIMVKMHDPVYEKAYRMAGATTICDMNSMFRHKIMTELESPNIKVISSLEKGQAQLITFQLPENWPKDGITVQDLAKKSAFSANCIIAGVLDEKTEKIVVPHGIDKIYPKNRIFMVAGPKSTKAIAKFIQNMHKNKSGIKRIF